MTTNKIILEFYWPFLSNKGLSYSNGITLEKKKRTVKRHYLTEEL